jgi:hypothetical protein
MADNRFASNERRQKKGFGQKDRKYRETNPRSGCNQAESRNLPREHHLDALAGFLLPLYCSELPRSSADENFAPRRETRQPSRKISSFPFFLLDLEF